MSKELIQGRIQEEIVSAISNSSITPQIVGSILNDILDYYTADSYKKIVASLSYNSQGGYSINYLENTFGYEPIISNVSNGNIRFNFQEYINKNKLLVSNIVSRNVDTLSEPGGSTIIVTANVYDSTVIDLTTKKYLTNPEFVSTPFDEIQDWVFELRLYPGSVYIPSPGSL